MFYIDMENLSNRFTSGTSNAYFKLAEMISLSR